MDVNDIEKLAGLFADKVKEITPHALELAHQMYMLSAFHGIVGAALAGTFTFVGYRLFKYCHKMHKGYQDSYDIGMGITAIGTTLSALATSGSLYVAFTNFVNAIYPAAAILKDLIK